MNLEKYPSQKMAKKLFHYPEIQVESIINIVSYNELSGVIRWKDDSGTRAKRGEEAGCITKIGNTYYRVIGILGRRMFCHRVAWAIHYGEWPSSMLDHIDGDGLNNRIDNLRLANHAINSKNTSLPSDNKSGRIGVRFSDKHKRWQSFIRVDGKTKYLGSFLNFDAACKARLEAEKLYGFHENHGRKKNT